MKDIFKPFGLTVGEARFVMLLSPDVKWRTKAAVETAYCTLLYAETQHEIARLNWINGRGVFEIR